MRVILAEWSPLSREEEGDVRGPATWPVGLTDAGPRNGDGAGGRGWGGDRKNRTPPEELSGKDEMPGSW